MKISIPLALLMTFFITACETGYKGDVNSSIEDNSSLKHRPKVSYTPRYKEPLSEELDIEEFSGGTDVSEGLDIGNIRVSEKPESARLVFDIYRWDNTSKHLGDKAEVVGSYSFDYDPEKLLITATVNDYHGFSAKLPKFSKNSIIENIKVDKESDNSGYKFYIKLRYDSTVKIFDLKNPGRIVIDISLL